MDWFPAEVLTAQHRYLKARVRLEGGTVVIRNKEGRKLEVIPVGEEGPTREGDWSVWPAVRARAMSGCGCGGTQIL